MSAENIELGVGDHRMLRGCVMVVAAIVALAFVVGVLMIALGLGKQKGNVGGLLAMLAFAAVMAFGARHLAQKVFASRVVLLGSGVELSSPLKRKRHVPYSDVAGVEEGTMEVSVAMQGHVGAEHVDVLRFRLANGETIALYAPDASARRRVLDAMSSRLELLA